MGHVFPYGAKCQVSSACGHVGVYLAPFSCSSKCIGIILGFDFQTPELHCDEKGFLVSTNFKSFLQPSYPPIIMRSSVAHTRHN